MTTNWQHYVKASYDIVLYAETDVYPELDITVEAYLVNLLARHFSKHSFTEKPVAISLMESMQLPGYQKKQAMATVGDECLFVHGFEYNRRKWPSATYYQDMGAIAYGHAAMAIRPVDDLYLHLEQNFPVMSKVIRQIKQMI